MMKLDSLYSDEELQDLCDQIRPSILDLTSDRPLATVGFPAYNEEDYLLPTLRNLGALDTSVPLEFLAVNNSSSDRTAEILRQCGLAVIDESQKGTSYARQALVESAQGEVIVQTDADTLVPPVWVDAHMLHYHDPTIVGVSGQVLMPGAHVSWKFAHFIYRRIRNTAFASRGEQDVGCGANFSALTESIRAVGYPSGFNAAEDKFVARGLQSLGKVVLDTSTEISVETNARRYDTFEKSVELIKSKFFSTAFWHRILTGKVTKQSDFEDFR